MSESASSSSSSGSVSSSSSSSSSSTATATPTRPPVATMSREEALEQLLDAAKRGDVERVNDLLDVRPNGDVVDARSSQQPREAALHVAARVGSVAVASALLLRSANVGVRTIDFDKHTPLHVAAAYGHADVASLLLSKGAAIDATTRYRRSALHLAARKGQWSVVEVLRQHGARVEAKDGDGWTPLMDACDAGATSVVTVLLKRGADANAQSLGDETPLHFAANSASCATVELLLSHGVDIEKRARDGSTVLHLCTDVDIARTLLAHGARVEAQNNLGDRPLYEAARRNASSYVPVLLAAGADVRAKGCLDQTAEQRAANGRHYTIARTLRSFTFLVIALLPRLVCAARALVSVRVDTTATSTPPLPHALLSLVVEKLASAEIIKRAPRFDESELKVTEGDSRLRADAKQREALTAPPDLHTQLSTDTRARAQLSRLAATVVAFAARRPVAPQSRAQFDAPFRRDLVLLAAARPDDDEALRPLLSVVSSSPPLTS